MPQYVQEGESRKNITATDTSIVSEPGKAAKKLLAILVGPVSGSPTLKVADDAGTILNTITPVAGTWYPMPCLIHGTLTVTIGDSVDATIFYGTA